jgi:hypothetical protein
MWRMSEHMILARLSAWWHRDEIDERLARGADPAGDRCLAYRAQRLLSTRGRRELAAALEEAVDEARRGWSVSARLPLRRAEVRACADDLLALAQRLRDGVPIDVTGAAMAARLVFDGTGPLFRDGPISLRYAARSARLALDPLIVDEHELWTAA